MAYFVYDAISYSKTDLNIFMIYSSCLRSITSLEQNIGNSDWLRGKTGQNL